VTSWVLNIIVSIYTNPLDVLRKSRVVKRWSLVPVVNQKLATAVKSTNVTSFNACDVEKLAWPLRVGLPEMKMLIFRAQRYAHVVWDR
jgi:hypothetical protein